MGNFDYLDSPDQVHIATAFQPVSHYKDFVIVADKNGARYMYAVSPDGTTVDRIDLKINAVLGSFNVPPLSTGEAGIAFGITYDRHYLILMVNDGIGVVLDTFVWVDFNGNSIKEAVNSLAVLLTYNQITWMRKRIYALDPFSSFVDVYDTSGQVINSIAITGLNGNYAGLTNDRKNLWLVDQGTPTVAGQIDHYDLSGNLLQRIPHPNFLSEDYSPGIAHNRHYKIVQNGPIPDEEPE